MLVRIKKREDYELCKGGLELARGKFYSFEEAEQVLGRSFKGVLTIRNIITQEEKVIKRDVLSRLENKRIVG